MPRSEAADTSSFLVSLIGSLFWQACSSYCYQTVTLSEFIVMEQPRKSGINPFYRLSADSPFLPAGACEPVKSSTKSANNNKNENCHRVPKVQKFDMVDTTPWPLKKKKCPNSSEILMRVPKSQGSCLASKIRKDPKMSIKDSEEGELSRSCFSLGTQAEEETEVNIKKPSENQESQAVVAEKRTPASSPHQDSDRCFTFFSICDKASKAPGTGKTCILPASSGGTASKTESQESPSLVRFSNPLPMPSTRSQARNLSSPSPAPLRTRSNTFVISESKSPLAGKAKENINLSREKSKLSKPLIASSFLRLPADQRRVKVEVDGQPEKDLSSTNLKSKEGPKRFESLLCNLRKFSPRQNSCTQSGRAIIETESGNTKRTSNRVGSPSSSRRHPSTSTLKLNQKIPTPTNPPVPIVKTTRQATSTEAASSNHFTPMITSRISRASKAARNEQTTGGKTARNEERSRTQSLSELKVRQQPSSSSCAGKTNATRSRLYVQRKTPAATSNYGTGSRSICALNNHHHLEAVLCTLLCLKKP